MLQKLVGGGGDVEHNFVRPGTIFPNAGLSVLIS